jgi:FkbM family methyltransferase
LFSFAIHRKGSNPSIGIHWFEPDKKLHDRLGKNLAANGVTSEGNLAAIAEKNGIATFFKNLTDDSSGSISDYFVDKHDTQPETVNTVALGSYLVDSGISHALVKVDVEGAGCAAWRGASIASDRIKYLIIEMLEPEIRSGLPLMIISEAGFHGYYIRDFELVEYCTGNYNYTSPFVNWLFCRLDCEQLENRLRETKFRVIPSKK